MSWRLARNAILLAALSLGHAAAFAQNTLTIIPTESQPHAPCSLRNGTDQPAGPEISIVDVTFSGSLQIPVDEQQQIANSIKQKIHGTSLDDLTDEALEWVRAGWQDRGYFKAQVTGETSTLSSSSASQRIAMRVYVDEGERYTLSRITFKNNKAISNVKALRRLFPIKDGDTFSRAKIAIGLENLRKAYGNFGYINFTSVPDTTFDDENHSISLDIDMDEGMQFVIGGVNVLGLDEPARQELLDGLPIKPGQIYNSRLYEAALLSSVAAPCECPKHEQLRQDNKSGIVTLTLDYRPCPAN
jgi:outer membrane protein insertion porin family